MFEMADGDEEGRAEVKVLPKGSAQDQPIEYGRAFLGDCSQEAIQALSWDGEYPVASSYANPRMAAAAALIAGDPIQTASYGPPAVFANLYVFAAHVLDGWGCLGL